MNMCNLKSCFSRNRLKNLVLKILGYLLVLVPQVSYKPVSYGKVSQSEISLSYFDCLMEYKKRPEIPGNFFLSSVFIFSNKHLRLTSINK